MPVYVQHEVLGKIPDVFNAEAIWQAPGLALFSRRPLLRDLLERSPREHRGRAATRCFSHVTLMLPQEEVDDDYHLTRGAKARDLAQTLTALHQKDFGDLLGADQVRYDVVGADTLDAGQIEVKFGHAVYLPAADEKILYNVSASRDSAIWKPVCPVYPNQRLALIGADHDSASYAAPDWPFGDQGAILLINDGPDAPLEVQMRPKDAFHCNYDAKTGYYTIKSARGGIDALGATPRLLLKIARVGAYAGAAAVATAAGAVGAAADNASTMLAGVAAGGASVRVGVGAAATAPAPGLAAAHPHPHPHPHPIMQAAAPTPAPRPSTPPRAAVWQARPGARGPDADAERTALPSAERRPFERLRGGENDATYAPVAQQRVSLVGLALPRLSRYRDTGAGALEIPFDRTLALSASGEPAISFVVNAADELYACTAAGRQRITAPADFAPVDARCIRLLAALPEMAERYCGTLCLAQPVSLPVAGGVRFVFGRNAPMLAALRLLDSPRFLHMAAGQSDGASADRIGLSRSAFSFETAADGYQIGRLAATQALYHLDEQLNFVALIGAASAEAPYLLPAGHHLVAGHYVLRFEA